MTLESVFEGAKKSYAKLGYPLDSWQWVDEGQVYAIMDYLSSCEDFTDADLAYAEKEGILDLCKEIKEHQHDDE